jgi:tetratricopeptide (TPR) repeat protein
MKDPGQLKILIYLLAFAGALLTGFGIVFGKKTRVIQVNTLNREARKAYNSAEYKAAFSSLQYMVDSLEFADEAARLDMANAGFLMSRYDSANHARDLAKDGYALDSVAVNAMKSSLTESGTTGLYEQLAETAENLTFSSIAYNQLGVIDYNLRSGEAEAEAMARAAGNFKSALKKDPTNDHARYNYELIRKRIDYPEMIMGQVRALIHQRKYKEARSLLRKAFEKDNQIKRNFAEYGQRLENIIRIDSLSRS